MRITRETLKVIKVFLEAPDNTHYGMEITKASGVQAGTLYPTLIRLEKNKWLTSDWEDIDPKTEGRSPRRYYKLTDYGKVQGWIELDSISIPNQGLQYA
jgi:PadR family transcriptional regulator, regulatory protein PadR